jgi:insulysin
MISDFHCKPLSNSNMTTDAAIVHVVDTIKKSDIDTWNYRGLELANGMLCVLISHSNIDKAAAALNVEIGSFADPNNVPGVAHFLEHMLFMGSTKVSLKSCFFMYIPKKKIILFSIPTKMIIPN